MLIQSSLVTRSTLFGVVWITCLFAAFSVTSAAETKRWQTYDGYNPDGYGRQIVFVSGDEEYRSEEALSMIGKLMAVRHGFKCTVLYAQDREEPGVINPQALDNIPGLEALRTADLMVIATRFRALPDAQMEEIDNYLRSGRPVVGLRTANHGFRFPEDSKWHHYSWRYNGPRKEWAEGFGGLVLGSWFFSHHGWHRQESTRGVVEKGAEKHVVLRGIGAGSVWGPTDVYGVKEPIPGIDVEILLRGQVLEGMNPDDKPIGKGPYEKAPDYVTEGSNNKNDPMQALAWTKSYQLPGGRKGRAFCTTMGSSTDLEAEGTRRLLVNAMFWCLGMDVPGKADVDIVDSYKPTEYRTHKREYWEERQLKVSDFDLQTPIYEAGGEPHGKPSAPYFDVTGGRDGHGYDFADHPVNRHRVYNFHRRQAAYYLDPENPVPEILANAPELDGSVFGHWGKFHKNSYKDRRWNLMDVGTVMSGVFRAGGKTYPKAIAVRLSGDLSCAFDTETLRFTHVWKGGFLTFQPNRWGIGNGITPAGEIIETSPPMAGWKSKKGGDASELKFHGYYRDGDRVIFHCSVNGIDIWESPVVVDGGFARDVEIVGIGEEDGVTSFSPGGIRYGTLRHEEVQKGGPALYGGMEITLAGRVGKQIPGSPFAIDRIPVPHQNEFGSMMFFGGHDFYSNGDAAVCTMMGDIWRVSGLDDSLNEVTWKRIATGLSQALGLAIYEDQIYVTCRDRIVRLHDLRGNGEIDFYENFSDDFEVSSGGHDFSVGLQRDENGYFYFVSAKEGVVRVSPDGSTAESLATGLRNTNGVGVTPYDNIVVTSTNQGDWTPASAVFEVQQGDFYGRQAKKEGAPIAPAMCYIPRTYCNSTGGQAFVDSEKWGELQGQLLTFSFGAGTWQMILRDTSGEGKRTQGALVPLPGDFESGAHRANFSPADGHLYVTGADGWGNYAITDGSFARIRYLGDEHSHLPVGWTAHRNGLLVELTHPIHPDSARPENFFAQTWNYEYSDAYGSLEYSLSQPSLPGHDPLPVKSVHLLEGGKKIFVEIPELQPAMQVQLYGGLKDKSGTDFVLDLYPTILWMHGDWKDFDGYTASDPDKPSELSLRVRWPTPFEPKVPQGKPGRKIDIEMVSGLQFSPTEVKVKAGEKISIHLYNSDSIPHNWLLAKPRTFQTVGMASSMMLSDPLAAARHYAPETDDVLHYSPMLYHRNRFALHLTAPEEPGRYPFMCTFPGHWAVMKGEMVVE
ncbi:MAG: plastocyanin/azurin family copper-binding protein [Verrucomicrobiales bacterium]|nr:plastocyanin/azurin family copper-binding protein [Verrucomicrobiales bacterium]